MAWQRFKVEIKGEDPVTVQSNVRDWASVPVNELQTLAGIFRVSHNALLRTRLTNVPLNFDAFMEVLDGIPEVLDEDVEPLDPTPTEASEPWPPPS
jgi:hypothetical protein